MCPGLRKRFKKGIPAAVTSQRKLPPLDFLIMFACLRAPFFCSDLAVVDPTFNSGPAHLETLHRLADRGYGGKIALQSRFEMMKPQYLEVKRLRRCTLLLLIFSLGGEIRGEDEREGDG